jgi:uncharacterized protein (TIGR03000 family)
VYSIVMLAAMSAAPEAPEFCCKKSYGCQSYTAGCNGCAGGSAGNAAQSGGRAGNAAPSGGCAGYASPGYSQGYGGGYGGCYGGGGQGGGCCVCGCICKLLSCFCCCGKGGGGYGGCYGGGGGNGGGYGYGYGSGGAVIAAFQAPQTNNEAVVVVRVPEDAKLFANGQPTNLSGTERIFATPDLTPGHDFNYTMSVEWTSNGETKTAKQQVTVRAGHRTMVDFTERATSAVTVSLPPNSRLMVDGIDTRMTGGKHTFKTPELSKGQPVSYEFRAEIERAGKMEVLTQKVSFKAGEPIAIDFIEAAERTAAK